MREQIKILSSQGVSIRKIAKALGMSRKTVRKVIGITDPRTGKITFTQLFVGVLPFSSYGHLYKLPCVVSLPFDRLREIGLYFRSW